MSCRHWFVVSSSEESITTMLSCTVLQLRPSVRYVQSQQKNLCHFGEKGDVISVIEICKSLCAQGNAAPRKPQGSLCGLHDEKSSQLPLPVWQQITYKLAVLTFMATPSYLGLLITACVCGCTLCSSTLLQDYFLRRSFSTALPVPSRTLCRTLQQLLTQL